ncbi:MAG: M48 family metalloprotease [Hyphomonadaceae bacterium]
MASSWVPAAFRALTKWTAAVAGCAALFAAPTPAAAQSVIRDAEIEQTLRDYGTPLWRAAGLDPASVQVVIVNDPTLNAFVTNGQNIFIHTGLILKAKNANQLKGVMAHETGHIAGGHLARSDDAMGKAMRPALVSIGLGILAMAAGAPDAGAALITGAPQFAMASMVRFSQVQEAAADQAGLSFLEESGQSGEGLLQFFENFRYEEVMSDARRSPYFRTHPLSSDRIQALRVRVEAAPHRAAVDTPEDAKRFAMMQAKLFGFIETPQRTFSKYPDTDQSMPARYARAVAAYRIPDINRAVREVSALVQADPRNPYFEELYGQILFENGKAADAVPHDRKALALKPGDPLLLINLARSLNGVGTPEAAQEAIKLLQASVSLEPDNPYAWREMASAYDAIGQDGMARLASAEQCFSMGDYPRALNFAQRAKKTLPEGTASWRRASDIAMVAESETRGRRHS